MRRGHSPGHSGAPACLRRLDGGGGHRAAEGDAVSGADTRAHPGPASTVTVYADLSVLVVPRHLRQLQVLADPGRSGYAHESGRVPDDERGRLRGREFGCDDEVRHAPEG